MTNSKPSTRRKPRQSLDGDQTVELDRDPTPQEEAAVFATADELQKKKLELTQMRVEHGLIGFLIGTNKNVGIHVAVLALGFLGVALLLVILRFDLSDTLWTVVDGIVGGMIAALAYVFGRATGRR